MTQRFFNSDEQVIYFMDINQLYRFIGKWHEQNPSAFEFNFGDKNELKSEVQKSNTIILESLKGL